MSFHTILGTMRQVAVFGGLSVGLAGVGCKSAPAPAAAPVVAGQPGQIVSGQAPGQGVQGTLNPDGTFTPSPGQAPVARQGTLNPDGTFTPNAVQPGQPAAARQALQPSYPASAPAGAVVPTAVYRTVPAGTRLAVTVTQTLSASRNNVGDGFTGVLAQPVTVDGGTVFARGTRVQGTVVAAKGRGRFKGAGALGIELTEIAGERVSTSEYERVQKGRGRRTAGFIGGGAGLGALIGGLAGGGKGAAIGALAGGGGGTAAAAYTGNRDVVIPSESLVMFRLTSSLRVR